MSETTISVLAITLVSLVVYDVIIFIKEGPQATISYDLLGLSRDYPIIPFALGVIAGHLFWPNGQ